jgi:hypothetical protein
MNCFNTQYTYYCVVIMKLHMVCVPSSERRNDVMTTADTSIMMIGRAVEVPLLK